MLTLLTFSLFLVDIKSDLGTNRMGIGMTILLVMQVEGVAISAWLPVCAELLWVQVFVFVNLLCAYFALVETMIVQTLADQSGASLLPMWLNFFLRDLFLRTKLFCVAGKLLPSCCIDDATRELAKHARGQQKWKPAIQRAADADPDHAAMPDQARVRQIFDRFDLDGDGRITQQELECVLRDLDVRMTAEEVLQMVSDLDITGSGDISFEEFQTTMSASDGLNIRLGALRTERERSMEDMKQAIMGNTDAFGITSYAGVVLRRKLHRVGIPPTDVRLECERREAAAARLVAQGADGRLQPGNAGKGGDQPPASELIQQWSEALTLAENLFFQMDTEAKGWIPNKVAADMLEFLIPDADPDSALNLLRSPMGEDLDDDGGLVRWEFVALCDKLIGQHEGGSERLKVAAENFTYAKAQEKRFYNVRWQSTAARIDRTSLTLGLFLYSTFLAVMFQVEFIDNYATDTKARPTDHLAMAMAAASPSAVFVMLLPCLLSTCIALAYLLVQRSSQARRFKSLAADAGAQKKASSTMRKEAEEARMVKRLSAEHQQAGSVAGEAAHKPMRPAVLTIPPTAPSVASHHATCSAHQCHDHEMSGDDWSTSAPCSPEPGSPHSPPTTSLQRSPSALQTLMRARSAKRANRRGTISQCGPGASPPTPGHYDSSEPPAEEV